MGRKGCAEKGRPKNITGPKKTGPKTKVGRKVTNPKILSKETETMSLCHQILVYKLNYEISKSKNICLHKTCLLT